MEREQVNLAAIMFTDIVAYTSLSESNESLALKLLDEHRRIIRPLLLAHNGREIKTIGDGFLVEFASAFEATRCAFEIQRALYTFNANRSPTERILLRIGIHLGDVIHSNNDIYGDAVNLASRVEGLCEPGGISVSRQVYDSVRSKVQDMRFESLGLRQMKNVRGGLEVFKVAMPWGEVSPLLYQQGDQIQPRNRIAVLPFVNIGPDQSEDFFADGLTEELISRLSQAKELRVIARTSAMNYKNEKQKKIRDIGRELGAGAIIEGSVRKAGNKVRISVQLINAMNEEHLWASTYDKDFDDIFEIQSDIASKVANSISSNLVPIVHKEDLEEEAPNLSAYTYYLRGRHLLSGENESTLLQALEFFNKAIEEDPTYARAYLGRAECYMYLSGFAHTPWLQACQKAQSDTEHALEIDPDLAEAHACMSRVKYALDEFSEAEEEARKAIELNPSLADAYHALGHTTWVKGKVKESTKLFETAYKLDPLGEENVRMLGEVYYDEGREEDALRLWSSIEHLFPKTAYGGMIGYYLDRKDYTKALEFLEKLRLAAGNDSIFTLVNEGIIAAYKGDRKQALDAINRIEGTSAQGAGAVGMVGFIYYYLGDVDKFFEYMDKAMEIHALPLGDLVNSPDFGQARKDPRLKKFLERLDLKINLP